MAIFDPTAFRKKQEIEHEEVQKTKPKKEPRPPVGLVMLKTGDRVSFECPEGHASFEKVADRLWYEEEWTYLYDAKGKLNVVLRRSEILSLYYVPGEEEVKCGE